MAEDVRTDLTGGALEADPVSKVVYGGPTISWRGIFAGAFVGILAYLALAALGMALGETGARSTRIAGWFFFATIVLGSLVALFAGAWAARRNIRHPLSNRDRRLAMAARPEWYGLTYGGRPVVPEPQST
jgi:hypothetical protein